MGVERGIPNSDRPQVKAIQSVGLANAKALRIATGPKATVIGDVKRERMGKSADRCRRNHPVSLCNSDQNLPFAGDGVASESNTPW